MPSHIKNKMKRQEVNVRRKLEKDKIRREQRLERKREREELGSSAPPKQDPKTLESLREADATVVAPDDNEVVEEEAHDEFAGYFRGDKKAKIMITTRPRPSSQLFTFIADLMMMMPNTFFYPRKTFELKDITKWAAKKDFTHLIVLGEKNKKCNQMLLCHLPDGPTALFKISSIKHQHQISNHATTSFHTPEIILNRFQTRIGHRVGRFLGSTFPHEPEFRGRNVVTFHNQRDFIFVRHHRYEFANNFERTNLQEIGPRFTLKLRWLMATNFDTKHGEYEWVHKRGEMDTSRRKFAL
mmetsp:Transcript_1139/g.1749  ORF Transcript_1139/g.1749 Transcript_1139/m.1749 type:complete len:298 (+) Transcript_1139:194-1087(+)